MGFSLKSTRPSSSWRTAWRGPAPKSPPRAPGAAAQLRRAAQGGRGGRHGGGAAKGAAAAERIGEGGSRFWKRSLQTWIKKPEFINQGGTAQIVIIWYFPGLL